MNFNNKVITTLWSYKSNNRTKKITNQVNSILVSLSQKIYLIVWHVTVHSFLSCLKYKTVIMKLLPQPTDPLVNPHYFVFVPNMHNVLVIHTFSYKLPSCRRLLKLIGLSIKKLFESMKNCPKYAKNEWLIMKMIKKLNPNKTAHPTKIKHIVKKYSKIVLLALLSF